jgi:hypothetical protein
MVKAGVVALELEDPLTKQFHKAKELINSPNPADQAEADRLFTGVLTALGKEAFGPDWELKEVNDA